MRRNLSKLLALKAKKKYDLYAFWNFLDLKFF